MGIRQSQAGFLEEYTFLIEKGVVFACESFDTPHERDARHSSVYAKRNLSTFVLWQREMQNRAETFWRYGSGVISHAVKRSYLLA
jgi:hypothetical protein